MSVALVAGGQVRSGCVRPNGPHRGICAVTTVVRYQVGVVCLTPCHDPTFDTNVGRKKRKTGEKERTMI